MTVLDLFSVVTALALIVIAGRELVQLARHPREPTLWVLVPGLLCLAFVVTIAVPVARPLRPVIAVLDRFQFGDIVWSLMAYCFAAFFLLARNPRARRQPVIEFGGFAVSVAVMLLVVHTAPPGTWHTPRLPQDYRGWRNIVYYLSVDGYALAVWALGAYRGVRYLRALQHGWSKIGLGLVLVGTAGMALGVDGVSLVRQVLYVAVPGSHWPALRIVYNSGRLGGQILLAVGLLSAPLAGQLVAVRCRYDRAVERRLQRRLAPLWRLLADELPGVALPAAPDQTGAAAGGVRPPGFGRATAEISDGLAQLSTYLQLPADDPGDRSPATVADLVVTALARHRATTARRHVGVPAPPGDDLAAGRPRLEPDFGVDWRRRGRWMAQLSRQLHARGIGSAPAPAEVRADALS